MNAIVYPVGVNGRYHWPLDEPSLEGLYSRCGRVRLDGDRGRAPSEVGPFQRCRHRACQREYGR